MHYHVWALIYKASLIFFHSYFFIPLPSAPSFLLLLVICYYMLARFYYMFSDQTIDKALPGKEYLSITIYTSPITASA